MGATPLYDPMEELKRRLAAIPRPPANPAGLTSPGNVNVYDRPVVPNPAEGKGQSSTVWSGSFGNDRGEVLVPRVTDGEDGKTPHLLSDRRINRQPSDMEQYYQKYGKSLGTFDTPEHATLYAQGLHNQQAGLVPYGGRTTLPTLITPQMKQALQGPLVPPPAPVNMPTAMQPLPMPAAPQVANVPNATDLTNRRLLTDQNELRRLQTSGSGIDQITKPVDASGNPTGAPVSGLRRFGGVLARIGDTAATLALGRGAAVIPGTTMRHFALQDRQAGLVNNGLDNQKEQAQTQQEQALTDFTLQRPDIEEAKVEQRLSAVKDRVSQAAAARGQIVDWSDPTNPKFHDDVTSQAYADHQALNAMHQATADKSKIQADIASNHYIPGTPEFEEAQRKLAQVDKRLGVAMASLGLRQQGLQLRKNAQNADFYNIGPDGGVLAGAPQVVNDAGDVTTVGRKNAATAIRQNQSVGTFNDLAGSVGHTRDALNQFFTEGGSLADPRIVAAMSDPNSTIGKVINGKLVQGGLSPNAIEAINAVRQLHEQAGILRKTTGGTASEAGAQRILDVVPSAGDANAVALQKLEEQDRVLQRLAPGQTRVAGGLSVRHQGGSQEKVFNPKTGRLE